MVQVAIPALLLVYTVCGLSHSLAFNVVESKRTTRLMMTILPGGDDKRQTGQTTMQRPLPRRALQKVSDIHVCCPLAHISCSKSISRGALFSFIYMLHQTFLQRKNKRRQRTERLHQKSMKDDSILQNEECEIETRPLLRRDTIEAGLDYWMDETDVMKERQRKTAFKNRKVCVVVQPAIVIILCSLVICFGFSIKVFILMSFISTKL